MKTPFFFKFPRATIIALTIISLFFVKQLVTLESDNSLEIWYNKDDTTFQDYQQFQKTFGNDFAIYIIYRSDALFTPQALDLNRRLTEELSKVSQVRNVVSLTNAKAFRRVTPWMTVAGPLVSESNTNLEESRFQATEDELYRDNVVSTDGKVTAIRIDLKSEKIATNQLVLAEIKEILAREEFAALNFYIMGNIPIIIELNRISNNESGRFVLVSILAIFALLLLTFKKIKMAIIPLVIAIVSVIWGMGIYALSGNTLNMISGIMPLVILVVSIAHSIHIISHYDREASEAGRDKAEALSSVLDRLFRPCLFTSLTTMVAFLGFNSSVIPTIKTMGTFTSIGVFVPFLLSFTLLPAILLLQKKPSSTQQASQIQIKIDLLLASLMTLIQKNRRPVLVIFAVVFIAAMPGLSRISFQTDQINYLRDDNPIRIANYKMRDWFQGVYPVEMVLSSEQPGYFYTSEGLDLIKQAELQVKKEPEVRKTLSPYSFYESYFFTSAGLRGADLFIEKGSDQFIRSLFEQPSDSEISSYISRDGAKARISIRAIWLNNQEVEKLIGNIRDRSAELLSAHQTKAVFTGTPVMYINLNQNIIRSQFFSFLVSFALIFLMLWGLFRNFKLALVGMLPNIFPVVLSLGAIGWLDIKMDVATILIAAITLGIAVDDTIHFLFSYTEHKAKGLDQEKQLAKVLESVGQPIVLTTLFLIFGFSVMIFSSFLPIVYFGIFIVFNVTVALVADLVLLPALLISTKDGKGDHPLTAQSAARTVKR